MGYLSASAEAGKFDLMAAVQHLQANGGPNGFRQAVHLLRHRFGSSGASYEEYFTYALWRADRGRAFLDEFLPGSRVKAFNAALAMPSRGVPTEVIADKLHTEAILLARGLPVTRTTAAFLPQGATDPALSDPALSDPALSDPALSGGALPLRPLHSAADIAAFLSDPANLPVFGKPRSDSFARGAAAIAEKASATVVRFLNGTTAPATALAAEIAADWSTGYLFQPFYQCHADLRRHVGPAMASVRIVTLLTDRGVEPWYAVIRVPAKTAMHDGGAADARIWGLIDLATGTITKIRNLRDPMTADVTHWLDPDTPLAGFTLPHWPQAMAAALAGHDSFPGHGIIGWDVFLTDAGALLNEANANPGHVYQVAAGRGLMNPDLAPAYARALAFAAQVNAAAPTGPIASA